MKIVLSFILTFFALSSFAWETEQFTLPRKEIADTGALISEYIYNQLETIITKINKKKKVFPNQILKLEKALKEKSSIEIKSNSKLINRNRREIHRIKKLIKIRKDFLEKFKTHEGISIIVSNAIGRKIAKEEKKDAIFGIPTKLTPEINGEKTFFTPSKFENIYAHAGYHRVLHPSYFIFSSTIKMYGVFIGMDKLGHFFNQGHQYYSMHINNENQKSIINWGIETERTFFGLWVSGIYSNADLASNFAGMLFYKNLFESVLINQKEYDSILEINDNGDVIFNYNVDNSPQKILERFITPHMNEALNPSYFEKLQRSPIIKKVKQKCSSWLKLYPFKNKTYYRNLRHSLKTYYGQDYGHLGNQEISIDQLCF